VHQAASCDFKFIIGIVLQSRIVVSEFVFQTIVFNPRFVTRIAVFNPKSAFCILAYIHVDF